jgi:probable addiction module antidote protein
MAEKLVPFDVSRYLGSEEAIAEYLSQILADGDTEELIAALAHVAQTRARILK